MKHGSTVKDDACFCDDCSKVCDSSCRSAAFHDTRMLSAAQLRGTYSQGL